MLRLGSSLVGLLVMACGAGGGFPDAKPKDDSNDPPPGHIKATWTVTDKANQPITCASIGGISVGLTLRSKDIAGGHAVAFSCQAGSGVSDDILPGTWSIEWELTGAAGTLAQAPKTEDVVVQAGSDTQVPAVVFAVDTTGNFKLHFTANKVGGNCGTVANGGAGITGTTLTLEHPPGGACEPATLNVGPSALTGSPGGTYTIDCTTPMVTTCIESDQEITTSAPIASGAYQIHAKGLIGASACFTNDDQFNVPAAGLSLTRTLNLGGAPVGTPGC